MLKAESEGFPQIVRLFRAAVKAETIHAMGHLRAMGDVHTAKENLDEAMKGESYEFKQTYPRFVKEAHDEQDMSALASFRNATAVEQVYYSLSSEAADTLGARQRLTIWNIFVCMRVDHGINT
jgi:rubrerythrin